MCLLRKIAEMVTLQWRIRGSLVLLILAAIGDAFSFNRTPLGSKSCRSVAYNAHNYGNMDKNEFSRNYAVQWKKLERIDVLIPKELDLPLGIVHFTGGLAVGSSPKVSYGAFLSGIAEQGFVVIATPYRINEWNHQVLACDVARDFRICYSEILSLYGGNIDSVPIFGMGHSLGAKLQVLMNCYNDTADVCCTRKANVLISFNNFAAKDSIPLYSEFRNLAMNIGTQTQLVHILGDSMKFFGLQNLSPLASKGLEFAVKLASSAELISNDFFPTPEQTWNLIENQYITTNNLVLQFKSDSLDQSYDLAKKLFDKFRNEGKLQFSTLDGTHITPNTPDLKDVDGAEWVNAMNLDDSNPLPKFNFAGNKIDEISEIAKQELRDLIKTVTVYLRSQVIWQRLQS